MALDQNLIALLTGQGGFKSGNPNALPSFTGGQGLDQNLIALLMSQGMLPRRIGMDGQYIMPNAGGNTSGFHSGSALDAFKSEGPMASRSMYAKQTPKMELVPNNAAEIAAAEMMAEQEAQAAKLRPTSIEEQAMANVRLSQFASDSQQRAGLRQSPVQPNGFEFSPRGRSAAAQYILGTSAINPKDALNHEAAVARIMSEPIQTRLPQSEHEAAVRRIMGDPAIKPKLKMKRTSPL